MFEQRYFHNLKNQIVWLWNQVLALAFVPGRGKINIICVWNCCLKMLQVKIVLEACPRLTPIASVGELWRF